MRWGNGPRVHRRYVDMGCEQRGKSEWCELRHQRLLQGTMKKMFVRKSLFSVLIVYLLFSVGLSAQDSTDAFSVTDWTDADASLGRAFHSANIQAGVRAFLSHREGPDAILCGYVFHDFTDLGAYALVMTVDYSGRHFCNTVIVVGKEHGAYKSARIDSWQTDSAAGIVQRLDQQSVLVVPQTLSLYAGNRCIATMPRIFRWTGSSLQDISAASAGFYQELRQSLQEKLDRLTSENDGSPALSCAIIERDAVLREIGVEPDAGLSTAREWAESPDQSLRLKAVYVLDRLGTRDAVAALESLSHDRDHVVATAARASIKRRLGQ